ncbi:glutathione peroxidase PWA37_005078 [Arxiozyma heterogenica]|uniref:Glutathione peroxidase n=1 Tax=Arxiozyma heterogenica TaxID=278026 RepID=A0AAN7WPB2_9SACH|nr:hypothetical protein RI543_000417 [Kazachstania heterogenica]
MNSNEFYDLIAYKGNGEIFRFDQLQGKVVLIVNVASRCGFTPQYKDLQYLYEKYSSRGLEILGFPCNQFGNQEPLSDKEIIFFTKKHFGITFHILKKINVNGPDEHPVYKYLKEQKRGVLGFKGIKWNFEKFLIDRSGIVTDRFLSATPPINFEDRIVELLNQPTI